ncbi:hypothetical protein LPJ56_002798, partial [Coemansia sp. RSA 2599]
MQAGWRWPFWDVWQKAAENRLDLLGFCFGPGRSALLRNEKRSARQASAAGWLPVPVPVPGRRLAPLVRLGACSRAASEVVRVVWSLGAGGPVGSWASSGRLFADRGADKREAGGTMACGEACEWERAAQRQAARGAALPAGQIHGARQRKGALHGDIQGAVPGSPCTSWLLNKERTALYQPVSARQLQRLYPAERA